MTCGNHGFFSLEAWQVQSVAFERIAWLNITGVPLPLATIDVIESIGASFGKVLHHPQSLDEDDDWSVTCVESTRSESIFSDDSPSVVPEAEPSGINGKRDDTVLMDEEFEEPVIPREGEGAPIIEEEVREDVRKTSGCINNEDNDNWERFYFVSGDKETRHKFRCKTSDSKFSRKGFSRKGQTQLNVSKSPLKSRPRKRSRVDLDDPFELNDLLGLNGSQHPRGPSIGEVREEVVVKDFRGDFDLNTKANTVDPDCCHRSDTE
ncbi:hypothetical protein Hanom_Chr07g00651591 [Helianthus anomalus]